jgi:Fe-S-cluster containining protein
LTTTKESLWRACKPKTCCHSAFVIPSGRDVWRISRMLEAPPWTFLVYFASPVPRRDAFRLTAGGPTFRLALAKGASKRTKTPPPCIFLLRTRQGHHRCGLGENRPSVCRSFPAELVDGVLTVRPDHGCTCRQWALPDMDIAAETGLVQTRQAEAEDYCRVVATWNARVAAAPPGTEFSFFDYCDGLLELYDALAAPVPVQVAP